MRLHRKSLQFAAVFSWSAICLAEAAQTASQLASMRHSTNARVSGALLLWLLAFPTLGQIPIKDAKVAVLQSIEAMGGIGRLGEIKTLRIERRSHDYLLDESERPDGPWSVIYEHATELRDYEHANLRRNSEHWFFAGTETQKSTLTLAGNVAQVTSGEKRFPASVYSGDPDNAIESLAFAPERLLLAALKARDLAVLPNVHFHGEPYEGVSFTLDQIPTRLYFNAYTHLLGVAEWTNSYPYSIFWQVWGDVANRAEFSVYSLLPGGLRLPLQRDYQRNGQPSSSVSIQSITVNPPLTPDTFAIDPQVAAAFANRIVTDFGMPHLGKPVSLIEDDNTLLQYVGEFNCAIVKQSDGLILIEAPVNSAHSKALVADAEQRFPGLPIKAVITTSDAWAHIGGLREMVARGFPVYATDLNRPLLTHLVQASFTQSPDSLAMKWRAPEFHWVSQKTTIGSGPNRLEIYPIRNASGERMLMIYFPHHKLLYSSDLIQPLGNGGFFWPEYLRELSDAVAREKLTVERCFGMHAGSTPWKAILQFLTKN